MNPPQADYLYQTALKYSVSQYYSGALADVSADDVMPDSELGSLALELYCGAGTISLGLSKLFRKVLAAEIVPEAVESAAYNARVNGVQNVEFICADAGEVADKLALGMTQAGVMEYIELAQEFGISFSVSRAAKTQCFALSLHAGLVC